MPLFQSETSIAAATVNDNLLAGSQWEFLPWPARIEFGIVGDANAADLRVDAYSGADALCENMQPSAQNRMAIYPDDFSLVDVANAGERLKVRVRNLNGAAARTVFLAVRIMPL